VIVSVVSVLVDFEIPTLVFLCSSQNWWVLFAADFVLFLVYRAGVGQGVYWISLIPGVFDFGGGNQMQ